MRYHKSLPVLLIAALLVVGCTQKPKSANSGEAIQHANTLQSVEAKVNYLVSEASAFLNSEQFDEAVKMAKYILSKLDSNSQEAKSILEQAKAKLEAMAREKAEELKGDLKNKLGNIGQ